METININIKKKHNLLSIINRKIEEKNKQLEGLHTFMQFHFKISDYSTKNLNYKISELKKELNSLTKAQNKNQKDIDEFKNQLQIHKKRYKDWSFCPSEEKQTMDDYKLLDEHIQKRIRYQDTLKSQLNNIDKNDTAQKNEINEINTKLKSLQKEISSLQNDLKERRTKIKIMKNESIKRIKERLSQLDHQERIDEISKQLDEFSMQKKYCPFVDDLIDMYNKVSTSKQQDLTVIQNQLDKIKIYVYSQMKELTEQNTENLLNYDNITDNKISFTENEIRLPDDKIKKIEKSNLQDSSIDIKNLERYVNSKINLKKMRLLVKLMNVAKLIDKSIKIKSELQKLQEQKENLKTDELKEYNFSGIIPGKEEKKSIKIPENFSMSGIMQGKKGINNSDKNKSLETKKKNKGKGE